MKKIFYTFTFLSLLNSQQLPYGKPQYFDIYIEKTIKKININTPKQFYDTLFKNINPIIHENTAVYYLELEIGSSEPIQFTILDSIFQESSTLYFIDLINNSWIGPYSKKNFIGKARILTGQMKTKKILIELSTSVDDMPKNHIESIINPNPEDKYSINSNINYKYFNRQPNKKILLTGYWPPSNEAIRAFSQNHLLNPNGWIGDNWEN